MASFHFSEKTPSDSLFNDINTLNKFQHEQFKELSDIVFEFLNEPSKTTKLLNQLEGFAEKNGISADKLKNTIKGLLSIPNAALKMNLNPEHLKEDLINLGLSEDKSMFFSEKYKVNLLALSKSVLGQTLMVNQLVDMEWKFGVTAASSEIQKVGNTFIQLKLVINKGNKMENVHMELSLPQFYSFLHEMERAKTSLEFFS
ncbi:COMM domain-containing protein 7-like [Tubulanus polymorphus]|uniref:COMM domain-containing protein 7-like n=1 Tax=Tubulanus polymorphus TaxID=672921 RepID=UPI003DA301DA